MTNLFLWIRTELFLFRLQIVHFTLCDGVSMFVHEVQSHVQSDSELWATRGEGAFGRVELQLGYLSAKKKGHATVTNK